jgi:DNA-binding MarR family transcriptional regulator
MRVPASDDHAALRTWRDATLYRKLMRAGRAEATQTLAGIHERGYRDVTLTDTNLLANLDTAGCTVSDLARRAGVTRQSASQQVAALVQAGYVTTQASPTDRRASVVIQTDKGRALLETALEVVAELEAEYSAVLGPRRHAALHQALDVLLEYSDPGGLLHLP